MLLQKRTDTRGVEISSMRKSIYLVTTTTSSQTHRFHPLPLVTPTSCSPHPLATPIHSTHSPQLSSILLTCAKFKVWMTIVENGWNVRVWLVGVVSRRWEWVECMRVATYPYTSCICSFLQQHPYFLFIFKMFFLIIIIAPFFSYSLPCPFPSPLSYVLLANTYLCA